MCKSTSDRAALKVTAVSVIHVNQTTKERKSYLITDSLLVFSEFEILVFFTLVLVLCDIDTGDKNFKISMVSKCLYHIKAKKTKLDCDI